MEIGFHDERHGSSSLKESFDCDSVERRTFDELASELWVCGWHTDRSPIISATLSGTSLVRELSGIRGGF